MEDHELVDPTLTSEALLYRLFHERGVRVFEPQPVIERCRCSRDRILSMLRQFSDEERRSMVGDDGRIGITCEFCSTHYHVEPGDVGIGRTPERPQPRPPRVPVEAAAQRHSAISRRTKATPRSISSSVMYSSGWCAWSMEPGPHTTVGRPCFWNRPASVP